MASRRRKAWKIIGLACVGLFAVAQLVPYGRSHAQRPVVQEPAWDSPSTRALAVRACFDCHSNETRWPWYSDVAPVSWLVQHDVDEGRGDLNLSEWNRPYEEAGEAAETVLDGKMPPGTYVWMHPAARLTETEKRALADGLRATLGARAANGDRR